MEARSNPYSPGAGRIPVALVGRNAQIEEWETSLLRIEDGLDARPMALYGLRGVGKTVLLLKLHEMALNRGWISACIEAVPKKSFREQLSVALESKLVDIARPSVGTKVLNALKTALSFSANIGMDPSFSFGLDFSKIQGSNAGTGNLSGDLQRLLTDLSKAGEELDVGVAILIDEAQDLSKDDMVALVTATQAVASRRLRVSIILGGLPTLPRLLAEARSYAERQFSYHHIDNLSIQEAEEALREPARLQKVEWTDKIVSKVIGLTEGYPFFLQEYGSTCWLLAQRSPIDEKVLQSAKNYARKQLDNGFFRSRWDRATAAEKSYLRAMAEDDDDASATVEIAFRLKTRPTTLSSLRMRLIQKGIIYAPEKGSVAFTIPQMARFIKRKMD